MKRLPIHAEDRIFLKSLEGDPGMVVLLMLKLYPTPVNADNLTFEMKWDQRKNRARKVLDDLSSDGFTALVKGEGYILTSPALRRISEFFTPIIMKQFDGMEVLAQGSQAQALSPALDAGTETVETVFVIEDESQLKMSTQNASALKKEEEESVLSLNSLTSSSDSNAQNVCVEIAPGVTTARVLECTSMLENFEDGVFLRGLSLEDIHPRMALGWIAQAYTQRAKLEAPARLVYSRLKDDEAPKPQAKFYAGWESHLPDEYLMAIGWIKLECGACHAEFSKLEELQAHEAMMMTCEYGCGERVHSAGELEEHHKTHAPKITTLAALPTDHRGARAWQLVKDELAIAMAKASFETWVRDTAAVDFTGNHLTVAVRNAYCRDWLESRLQGKVDAMLKKFLQQAVTVSFVVGKIEGEE